MMRALRLLCFLAVALGAGIACAMEDERPPFIHDPIRAQQYDGVDDDLLTAGLGAAGLQRAVPPEIKDALHPTPAELRRRAIYQNYRALVDVAPNGGYGSLYGPTVGPGGTMLPNDGKIAGAEYLAFAGGGGSRARVTMLVQVPRTFDPRQPCIVAAPSSGSRGIYGAIGTAGEWGLKHGCAVAYTDKGTGNGAHDLQGDTVNLIDGTRASATPAGKRSNFTAKLSPAALAAFNAATPNRFAFKHAHSQLNPERTWGEDVLDAIRFAFFVLNEHHAGERSGGHGGPAIRRDGTIVIASSVSNGGGASLAAAELDRQGWIDGVAVSEPQVQLVPDRRLRIMRGNDAVADFGKTLFDYFTIANLYQPCAALANDASPGLGLIASQNRAANRCAALHGNGLLAADALPAQAAEALDRLHAAGWEAESDLLHASHYAFAVPAVAISYANAYGRFSVADDLCGYSFAATDGATGAPVAAAPENVAKIFADGNGIPPTGGINIVNNRSVDGARLDGISVSPSTNALDLNVDGALCLRALATGVDRQAADHPVDGPDGAARVQAGIVQTLRTGDLHGKPAIIVHGRADTLVPVNHASRPYYGTSRLREGSRSQLRYYEITNAQHFDAFIDNPGLPGYDTALVPLHYYFLQALDLMFDRLRAGTVLPPSQVVRTTPRGGAPGAAPAIAPANVPPIAAQPAGRDLIELSGRTLRVPD